MTILINTDNHIGSRDDLTELARLEVESALGHLAEHITRVEVHLGDENAGKGGAQDKRCMMEARLERHQPVAVTAEAESIGQAIVEAAEKLKHRVDHTLGRLRAVRD